jgi:hypothetical protein
MKFCRICKQPYDGPYKTCDPCRENNRRVGRNFYDRHPGYRQEQYQRNRATELRAANERNKKNRELIWANYFNGEHKCERCGDYYDVRILHMHHINRDGGDHKKEISAGLGGPYYYLKLIKAGFPKMEVLSVCPTCHALIHLNQT